MLIFATWRHLCNIHVIKNINVLVPMVLDEMLMWKIAISYWTSIWNMPFISWIPLFSFNFILHYLDFHSRIYTMFQVLIRLCPTQGIFFSKILLSLLTLFSRLASIKIHKKILNTKVIITKYMVLVFTLQITESWKYIWNSNI